jgi:hypothetical protein
MASCCSQNPSPEVAKFLLSPRAACGFFQHKYFLFRLKLLQRPENDLGLYDRLKIAQLISDEVFNSFKKTSESKIIVESDGYKVEAKWS